jgi:dCMP deaminase
VRPSKDEWAMKMAILTAQRGTCLRRKVGCVLLNARGHVLSTGYNGRAAGLLHCNEEPSDAWIFNARSLHPYACTGADAPSGTNLDGCEAIHAEQNALLQCRDVYDIHTCYTTTAPCVTCTKLLMNTGCLRIVSHEDYPHSTEARRMWEDTGRAWEKLLCV